MATRSSGSTPLADDVFARAPRLRIFISSQMRGGALALERKAAIEHIRSSPYFEPWSWEENAYASPSCSEEVCVGNARNSDGLVLILGEELTPITEKEYLAAKERGVACMILVKEGVSPSRRAARFLETERRDHAVTVNFRNISELRSQITAALRGNLADAWRRDREFRVKRSTVNRTTVRIRIPARLGRKR
jgi:hypothetical protein